MKKIIFVLLFVSYAGSSFADNIEVTRDRRRIFGYKEVIETVANERHILNCSGPGLIRCKTYGFVNLGVGTILTEEEFKK